MSEDHNSSGSGSGIGKMIVLLIFGLMVGFYIANVMSSGNDEHAPEHMTVAKFSEADYEKVKAEREASLVEVAKLTAEREVSLVEVAKLTEKLVTFESRAIESEYRLGRVRSLLVAEERVSEK
jgi:hypothetical protein